MIQQFSFMGMTLAESETLMVLLRHSILMDYPLLSLSSLKPFNTTAHKKQNKLISVFSFLLTIFPSCVCALELWEGEKEGKRPGPINFQSSSQ